MTDPSAYFFALASGPRTLSRVTVCGRDIVCPGPFFPYENYQLMNDEANILFLLKEELYHGC